MQVAARTGAWTPSGAPLPYDAEVEYLECTGIEYIESKIVPSSFVHPKAFIRLAQFFYSSGPVLFGAYSGGRFNVYVDANFQVGLGDRIIALATNSETNGKICEVEIDSKNHTASLKFDSEQRTYSAYVYVPCTTNLTMFARKYDGIQKSSKMRLYNFRFYDDNSLVSDHIPVRFTNENGVSEGAMYDRVSGQLFRNQGTGAFIIGPDKTV